MGSRDVGRDEHQTSQVTSIIKGRVKRSGSSRAKLTFLQPMQQLRPKVTTVKKNISTMIPTRVYPRIFAAISFAWDSSPSGSVWLPLPVLFRPRPNPAAAAGQCMASTFMSSSSPAHNGSDRIKREQTVSGGCTPVIVLIVKCVASIYSGVIRPPGYSNFADAADAMMI